MIDKTLRARTSAPTVQQILLPKAPKKKPQSYSATFDPESRNDVLTLPSFKEHLDDLLNDRQREDSRTLIANLVVSDPDASAALGSYLTTADVNPLIVVKDMDNQIDREGLKLANQIVEALTQTFDYTQGFSNKRSLRAIAEDLRYMLLVRGGIAAEAIYD